jgi:hypothetical protein
MSSVTDIPHLHALTTLGGIADIGTGIFFALSLFPNFAHLGEQNALTSCDWLNLHLLSFIKLLPGSTLCNIVWERQQGQSFDG